MAWWRVEGRLHRFLCDLVRSHLAAARRGGDALPGLPWAPGLDLAQALGVDSLERWDLAAAFGEAIELHHAGIEDALLARRTLDGWAEVARAGLERYDATLTFRTSGSTGEPKRCRHHLADLDDEARELSALLRPPERLLVAVPSHHIYGFIFSILLPTCLRMAEGRVVDVRNASPAAVAGMLRPGDLLIGHPSFWTALAGALPRGLVEVEGVTSTGPCPDPVALSIESSGLRLLQVYGASETAGIGWRERCVDGFRLLRRWRPVEGLEDRIEALGGSRPGRTLLLPDHVTWHADGCFTVGRRRDGAVQVGGHNVFPQAVREVLREHPDVEDAAVRLMHPLEGARLKAYVVPSPRLRRETQQLEKSLREHVRARLAPPERPQAITFGPALPTDAQGKLCDWRIDAAQS